MENKTSSANRPELIFGLVAPLGARLEDLSRAIQNQLKTFGYTSTEIRLSRLLDAFPGGQSSEGMTEFARIEYLQQRGNDFCRELKDRAALARAAIAAIRDERQKITHARDADSPAGSHAFILSQLKRPEEVDLLGQVYGSSFYLIGGHAPEKVREKDLAVRHARKLNRIDQEKKYRPNASALIQSDEKQEDEFGQNTRDTYPKADFMVNLGLENGEKEVDRFVELLFCHPLTVPTAAEYAMHQASAVSLRSSDDSRQVGAAIVKLREDPKDQSKLTIAELIALGMNEVPRAGGAPYYDHYSPDARDQWLQRWGDDRATNFKVSTLSELLERLRKIGLVNREPSTEELALEVLPALGGTQFMNMGEFSRPVHGEMAALIDAARRGVAVDGLWMFVTTFPCHNCAKHIIAAGLSKVVYLEPYPKSRAADLYPEELDLEGTDEKTVAGKVVFRSFSGVAPRLYGRIFAMSERGKKSGRTLREWDERRTELIPLYVARNAAAAYVVSEREELKKLPSDDSSHGERVSADVSPA